MPDREKAIKGLECCTDPLKAHCPECPYYPCYDEDTTSEKLLADALALLKGQEPVKFKVTRQDKSYPFWDSVCTGCGYKTSTVKYYWKYCPVCGKAVKWDDSD